MTMIPKNWKRLSASGASILMMLACSSTAQAQIARVAVVQRVTEKKALGAAQWQSVGRGAGLSVGDSFRTGKRSKADIRFSDGSLLRLGQLSSVEMRSTKGVRLTSGQLLFSALKPGRVLAGTAAGEIKGSVGIITLREDGSSEFTLYSGAMDIVTGNSRVELPPGNSLTASASGLLSALRPAVPLSVSDLTASPSQAPYAGSQSNTLDRASADRVADNEALALGANMGMLEQFNPLSATPIVPPVVPPPVGVPPVVPPPVDVPPVPPVLVPTPEPPKEGEGGNGKGNNGNGSGNGGNLGGDGKGKNGTGTTSPIIPIIPTGTTSPIIPIIPTGTNSGTGTSNPIIPIIPISPTGTSTGIGTTVGTGTTIGTGTTVGTGTTIGTGATATASGTGFGFDISGGTSGTGATAGIATRIDPNAPIGDVPIRLALNLDGQNVMRIAYLDDAAIASPGAGVQADSLDLAAALAHLEQATRSDSGRRAGAELQVIGGLGNSDTSVAGGRLGFFGTQGKLSFNLAFQKLGVRSRGALGRQTRNYDAVSEASVSFKDRRGAIQIGRQRFLDGPTQATLFGSLLRQGAREIMDAARFSPSVGANRRLGIAYLYDAFPTNLPYRVAGHQSGYLARFSIQKPQANIGLNLLRYQNSPVGGTTGLSVDFALPIARDQVELYGELGRDTYRRSLRTVGLTFPGLYQKLATDIFIEYARLGSSSIAPGPPSELALRAYRRLNDNLNLLLSVSRFQGEDVTFLIGFSLGGRADLRDNLNTLR